MKILLITGNTFPVKDTLVLFGGQWRPDKGGFVLPLSDTTKMIVEMLQVNHPKYNLDLYEMDEDKLVKKKSRVSKQKAFSACRDLVDILKLQHLNITESKIDSIERLADEEIDFVYHCIETIKAYILEKPIDESLRNFDEKYSNCLSMLCGSTVYKLRLTEKAHLEIAVLGKNGKPTLQLAGTLTPEQEKRFLEI